MAEIFRKIVVENSKLRNLQAKDFEGLKSLKSTIVRGNKIKAIHPETFIDIPQIEHSDLSGNVIKELLLQMCSLLWTN